MELDIKMHLTARLRLSVKVTVSTVNFCLTKKQTMLLVQQQLVRSTCSQKTSVRFHTVKYLHWEQI